MTAQNWLFCLLKVKSSSGKKGQCVDHEGIVYLIGGSSNYSYTSKGGYETFQQQWMPILTTQGLIPQADLILNNGHFA